MSLRSGFSRSCSPRCAKEVLARKEDTDEGLLDGNSLGGGSRFVGGDFDDSPKDDGSPDGSSGLMVLLVHVLLMVVASPKAGVPQEGDGLEGKEQLRLKKNKKSNLGSLVWLVVFRLLAVVHSLLVDGSKCDHINANLCNPVEINM